MNTLGFLFESLVLRDLLCYSEAFGASLYHYQDYSDRELDAVIEMPDGEWVELQGDWTVKSGEIQTKLQMLAENAKNVTNGTPIELRCRYDCEPGGETAGFSTEFSNVLTISAEAMQISSETAPAETVAAASTTKTANAPSTQQKALGWLWILLLIVAVIVLLIIIFLLSRRNKEDKK